MIRSSRRRRTALPLWLGLLVALPACGDGREETPPLPADPADAAPELPADSAEAPRAPSTFSVRDSAGITIVENTAPAGQAPWAIEEAPFLAVGGPGAAGDETLYQVVGAVGLADGGLLVANGGSNEILRFSSAGELVSRTGGEGQGPGEMLRLSGILAIGGGSVAAHDMRGRRLTVFDNQGRLVSTVSTVGARDGLVIARFRDGSYALASSSFSPSARGPTRIERIPKLLHFLRDSIVQVIDTVPWIETVIAPSRLALSDNTSTMFVHPRAFGRDTYVAADSLGWVVGDNDRPELHYLSPSGDLVRIVRWSAQPRLVTDEDVKRFFDRLLARISDPARRRRAAEGYAQHPAPPRTMPWFGWPDFRTSGILLDAARNAWVKEYTPEVENDANRYLLFDPEGVWLGGVQFPDGLSPMWIGEDRLIAVTRDKLGVEAVSMHWIRRGG